MNLRSTIRFIGLWVSLVCLYPVASYAQFYTGSHQDFGKNRLQFDEDREWQHFDFPQYNIYFYGTGKNLAVFTAKRAQENLNRLEKFFDYRLQGKVFILVFNNIEDYRESNIGLEDGSDQNIGGTFRLHGNKLFVYFEGDHNQLEKNIRAGIAEILFLQMGYGDNWKEIIKNAALLTIPDWYADGLTSFATEKWSVEIDDRTRDAVLNNRFRKFNRLTGEEARYAGHALWHYVASVYGEDVIPNIIYMTRISRNVESGFLYVLGVSLATLVEDARKFYQDKYEADEKTRKLNEEDQLRVRTRRSRSYDNFVVNSDDKWAAFTSEEFSQKRIYLYNQTKQRKRKLKKLGHKLDRDPDMTYPILEWHPNGEILTVIYEKRGEILMNNYDVTTKKWEKRKFRNLERVLEVDYSTDGRTLVLSAIRNGQVDLFAYKMMTNSQEQLTFDVFDDREPRFIPGTNQIIFTSNRPSDTLRKENDFERIIDRNDLFVFDYGSKDQLLQRITNTPEVNETQPYGLGDNKFLFLSDESGITNRYLGTLDSMISRIDTTIHYRYFTKTQPVTNYKRNILHHQVDPASGKLIDMVYYQGRYRFYRSSIDNMTVVAGLQDTDFQANEQQPGATDSTEPVQASSKIVIRNVEVLPKSDPLSTDSQLVDINNYRFENEDQWRQQDGRAGRDRPFTSREPTKDSRFIKLRTTQADSLANQFTLPRQENYRTAFIANDVAIQLDWNFANQIYQRFNGGPYIAPGMGIVAKLGITELMEDYTMEGGMRYSLDGDNTEYFFRYLNRKRRLDREFLFQRQVQTQQIETFTTTKTYIHKVSAIYKWPISVVAAVRGTAMFRNDRDVTQSTDIVTLREEDRVSNWLGLKLEYIFDNTRDLGLNLYSGTRYKLFAEGYYETGMEKSDIFVVGFDVRDYKKIHRDLIWANRIAGSSSFGNRKLVYYLGGVDNWMTFNQNIFDRDQEIDRDQGYYFQTIATPLRGFLQNIRNGNSFVVLNSEIRWPVFSYFIQKPIKSEFIKTFQLVGFGDVGTAWTGFDPYSEDNSFNTRTIRSGGGTVVVRLENKNDPIVGSYGLGARAKVFGYFVRFDYAWGVEDGIVQDPMAHFSLALDF